MIATRWFVFALAAGSRLVSGQAGPLAASTPMATRPIGPVIARSAAIFKRPSEINHLSDGRVVVHDPLSHKVVMFDSTLRTTTIVIDSAGGKPNSYGTRPGLLIRHTGDSSIWADANSSSFIVINPDGSLGKSIAMPTSMGQSVYQYYTMPTSFGYPAYSPRLGIVGGAPYSAPPRTPLKTMGGDTTRSVDSALVIAYHLDTRAIDTITKIAMGSSRYSYYNDGVRIGGGGSRDLYPILDTYAAIPSGGVAVLRGLDYRIDWIDTKGVVTAGKRIPYSWRQNTDSIKRSIVDSLNRGKTAAYDSSMVRFKANPNEFRTRTISLGADGTLGEPTYGAPRAPAAPTLIDPKQIPDFMPSFNITAAPSFLVDREGRAWIRPAPVGPVTGGIIYDVVSRDGPVDRVQIPEGHYLLGFGPAGVVYLYGPDAGTYFVSKVRFK